MCGRSFLRWAPFTVASSLSISAGVWTCPPPASAPFAGAHSGDTSMASALNFPRIGVALLAVASTAILVWFGYGLNPWWPLLWVAPLPVLLFAARNSWGNAALVAAC